MIKRWVYVALAFGLGMSAMSCENQKFNENVNSNEPVF